MPSSDWQSSRRYECISTYLKYSVNNARREKYQNSNVETMEWMNGQYHTLIETEEEFPSGGSWEMSRNSLCKGKQGHYRWRDSTQHVQRYRVR